MTDISAVDNSPHGNPSEMFKPQGDTNDAEATTPAAARPEERR
ncbi:hypothetical protein [Sanguibacter sp. 25GB23B1]